MRTDEVVAEAHFTSEVLKSTIMVDGEPVIIGEASAEDFDIYIYSILYQMYNRKKRAENRYEMSFWEYDFAFPFYRVLALNKLRQLNRVRMAHPYHKPEVPLFVEDAV